MTTGEFEILAEYKKVLIPTVWRMSTDMTVSGLKGFVGI